MDAIAGHRIVRVVRHEGERRVLAGFGDGPVEVHVGSGDAAATVAHEAEVLLAVPHDHLLTVLDVATVDGEVVLVRPASRSTLAAWLLARGAPQPGEVVTVLAPVLDAVAALHAVGATAGRIDLHAIVLSDDGAPALVGIGAARETTRATDAWRTASAGVASDCAALAALVDDLLVAADERAPEAVTAALVARDAAGASAALLAAWPALPVAHTRAEAVVARPRRERGRQRASTEAPVVVRWAQAALAQASLVRRPVWIAAGAGAIALVVAVALGGAQASVADEAPPASTPAVSDAAASPDDDAAPPVATTPPSSDADPVAAATALLAAREACLDADDTACLAGILDPTGGAAASSWRAPADAVLAQVAVLGDAVLVDVASDSEPASVLVVRTDAGWLLRDAWAA